MIKSLKKTPQPSTCHSKVSHTVEQKKPQQRGRDQLEIKVQRGLQMLQEVGSLVLQIEDGSGKPLEITPTSREREQLMH